MAPYRIAVIGIGKIAQDEHLPSIARNPRFELAALVSGRGVVQAGVPTFRRASELYAALPGLDAVAVATPPGARTALVREALDAGVDVLLEKPPTPTVGELRDLAAHADRRGRLMFTTWHSQYNGAVEETRARLAGRTIKRLSIIWKEDVRRWHPGQDWIWDSAGFGVFDPGINALSILTRIMPAPVFVRSATLLTPSNRAMPIAASLAFDSPAMTGPPFAGFGDSDMTAEFDWRQTGDQTWDFAIDLDDGTALRLTGGGTTLEVDGETVVSGAPNEYDRIYERFAALLDTRTSLVDMAPFELVADAFMVGRRLETEPFTD